MVANRIRRQVIPVCQKLLQEPELSRSERYWATATMAEACYGLANMAQFDTLLVKATEIAPEPWMVASTQEQIGKLAALLAETARTTPRGDGA